MKPAVLLTLFICLSSVARAEPVLTSLDGNPLPFSSMKGKWIMINYWASWCHSCLNEIPALNQFYEKNNGRIAVYGVNFDDLPVDAQKELIKKYQIHYPGLGSDPADILKIGNIPGVPATFIFNRQGELVQSLFGEQSFRHLTAVFAKLEA